MSDDPIVKHSGRDAQLDEARQALAALTDPLARAVLDLHHEQGMYRESGYPWPTCDGCDMDGYEAEPPEWPCRTVQAVARHYGIALPE